MTADYNTPSGHWTLADSSTNLYVRPHPNDIIEYLTYRQYDNDIIVYHGGVNAERVRQNRRGLTDRLGLVLTVSAQVSTTNYYRIFKLTTNRRTDYLKADNIGEAGSVPYHDYPDADWGVFPNLASALDFITRITGLKAG